MQIDVLAAAMNQTDHSLLDKMNIQSGVIVGNQCGTNQIEGFEYKGHPAVYVSTATKGVGLNRNAALLASKGDICLFADDDMRYVDGYPEIINKAFTELPDADVIIFNLIETNGNRCRIQNVQRVKWYNFMRYGAVRIAVRKDILDFNGIFFNLQFGGGTKFCHGEDTLFLSDCVKKKLRIYAYPADIAELLEDRESSWFQGYNDKYFYDTAMLYYQMAPRFAKLLCLQDVLRHRNTYAQHGSFQENYHLMKKAVRNAKNKQFAPFQPSK